MGLHKLTAGDGYAYLTRQVAVHDSTEKGHTGLGGYYSQRGESPGRWLGSGLVGLDGVTPGDHVAAEQMKTLFGEGRHPNAEAIERATIAAGGSKRDALRCSRLGRAFAIFEGESEFRIEVARRFTTYNIDRHGKWNAPIPPRERARIRTEVGREMFTAEFGREPGDARELSGFIARASRQATTAVAGYDLTFSPVKSVSTLWAVAPREVAEQIEAAHQAAIADTVGYLEREVAFTREGRAGVRQVEVTGLIAAAFAHRDPARATPICTPSSRCRTRSRPGTGGGWPSTAGSCTRRRCRRRSTTTPGSKPNSSTGSGVAFEDRPDADARKRPVREIVGVDTRLTEFWSRRRASIDARRAELTAQFQADHHRPPTDIEAVHLAQQATLETRDRKHEPRSFAEQRAAWREQALSILGRAGLRRMLRDVTRGGGERRDMTDEWVASTAAHTLATVSEARATWQVWHVRAEAYRRARAAGIALADLHSAVDKIVDEVLSPTRSIPLGAEDPLEEPARLRRSDGASVYSVAGSRLYTSRAVIDAEQLLVAAAGRHDGRRLTRTEVDLALLESTANRVTLNDMQAQMVRELATSGARVQLAIAPAGSGKTTAMRTLASAWTANGGRIIGLAPSAAAAATLRAAIGTRTDTLAKLTHCLDTGLMPKWVRGIDAATLIIIDEAGMAGTGDLAQAVDYILRRGGSVRLVGDDQQLASIAAGGVLRDIADAAGVVTLSQLMRFTDPAEAAATLALRTGDPASLGFYLDNGRVHVGDEATVAEHAYQAWSADRAAGLDSVMLAPTRDLVVDPEHARPQRPARRTRRQTRPRGPARGRQPGQPRRHDHHPPQRPRTGHHRYRLGEKRRPLDHHESSARRRAEGAAPRHTADHHAARRLRQRPRRTRLRVHRARRAGHHRRLLPHPRRRRGEPATVLRRHDPRPRRQPRLPGHRPRRRPAQRHQTRIAVPAHRDRHPHRHARPRRVAAVGHQPDPRARRPQRAAARRRRPLPRRARLRRRARPRRPTG